MRASVDAPACAATEADRRLKSARARARLCATQQSYCRGGRSCGKVRMPSKGMPQWKTPTIKTQIVLHGAHLKDATPLEVKEVSCPSAGGDGVSIIKFVEVGKCQPWLFKAVLGPNAQQGSIQESTIITELRKNMDQRAMGAEAGHASAVADAGDPMAALAIRSAKTDPTAGKANATSAGEVRTPKNKRGADEIVSVDVLDLFGGDTKRPVKLLRGNRGKMYLELDEVPWLVVFVASEMESGGFEGIKDPHGLEDPTRSQEGGGASAVADLFKTRWDPTKKMWVSIWLDGPKKGETVHVPMKTFTRGKYDNVRTHDGDLPPWREATDADKKNAACKMLTKYMEEEAQKIAQQGGA